MSEVRPVAEAPDDRQEPGGRLLTVGIPVFNGRSLLRNCLQSVVGSTLSRHRFEIVVVDDGSTQPETLGLLQEFADRLAPDPGFFRVIRLDVNSGGAARPRNRILDEAVGAYVFFLDADDTIGALALERIAEAVETAPADWIALNQVPVNGRAATCVITRPYAEVRRDRALTTLTVHKVFRRAEVERQQLRFDEGLPSGQDVAFAFAYILRASRFLMLGGYDFYYLTQHVGNPNEPAHLSRRAKAPGAVIEKNERILRSMLTALHDSGLPEEERRTILGDVALPRLLIQELYLKSIVDVGLLTGTEALDRLSALLTDPLLDDLEPAVRKGLTREHLAVVARSDWPGLEALLGTADVLAPPRVGLAQRLLERHRRFVDTASGRARHRRVMDELALLRRSLNDLQEGQRRLEAILQGRHPAADQPVPGPFLDPRS